jgi:glycosyltransferase involved in cell wall biosynthesis
MSAVQDAEVVLAMPVHNPGPHLTEALGTLLAQEGPSLAVVALDDCSADGTAERLKQVAQDDERLVVHLSRTRLGIPRAWNRAMRLALDAAPRARFAAWAGDHDRWVRGWLHALGSALDERPEAALALALTRKIDKEGMTLRDDERRLDTCGIASPLERVRATASQMTAGNQVYGLFRRSALERVLPIPHVLLYDRILLAAIALEGSVVQVDDYLWERRSFAKPIETVLDRERAAFWPEGSPLWARLPPVVQGGATLVSAAARGRLGQGLPRRTAFMAAAIYIAETWSRERRTKARRRRQARKATA